MAAQLVGVILALSSALVYGSADFFGGLATRRQHPYAVLVLTSLIGTACMVILAFLFGEHIPSPKGIFWGGVAGISGLFGLVLLYYGLAKGNTAVVSPISGVVAACLPVLYSAFLYSLPSPIQIAGFILAVPGIVLVTQIKSPKQSALPNLRHLWLRARESLVDAGIGSLAGLFFGVFFICLSQLKEGSVFGPLAFAKLSSCLVGLVLALLTRVKLTNWQNNLAIIPAGLFDPIANALYLLATRYTRLDVAVVLTSLYPAGTVFLSFIYLKEPITGLQWIGVAFCLLSIMLITS